MKDYIVIFREPDGREEHHSNEGIKTHRTNWNAWLEKWQQAGNLKGGSALTLNGCLITGSGSSISNQIHRNGPEIVGGFLLLKAKTLEMAAEITASCPIYEFGGYAEVREYMQS